MKAVNINESTNNMQVLKFNELKKLKASYQLKLNLIYKRKRDEHEEESLTLKSVYRSIANSTTLRINIMQLTTNAARFKNKRDSYVSLTANEFSRRF